MTEQKKTRRLTLRTRMMAALALAVIVVGVVTTALSYGVLRHTLADSTLAAESAETIARQFAQTLTGLALIEIAGAVLGAVLLARILTAPIQRLLNRVARIAVDGAEARIQLSEQDALNALAETINDMAYRLQQSHKDFGHEVEQRTAALSSINEALEREIADRIQAEEKLKESLSLTEATLESTADGILVTDMTGRIRGFNTRFKELWRIPDAVLESGEDDEAVSFVKDQLNDPEAFLNKVKELYRQPQKESLDILTFKDGRVVERYSKPRMIGKQIVGRVWGFRDITEQHRAQQEQDKLLRRVEDINEELTHFAYVVSHDLKAPLRGIKLLADWLRVDCGEQLGDEGKENLRLLQNRVDRMHNLIEGVLQYSRVGRIKEKRIDVDLNELVPGIVDAIAPPDYVSITVQGPLPTILCERTRITQIFQNLLTNAVKYMDKPAGEITVACTDQPEIWTFQVADNGPGIEEKHFDRIFKIFQTLAPRDEFESTGVGLTLVKKIVEHYGGSVWVESEVGRGSTFFFTLPKPVEPPGSLEEAELAGCASPAEHDPSMNDIDDATAGG